MTMKPLRKSPETRVPAPFSDPTIVLGALLLNDVFNRISIGNPDQGICPTTREIEQFETTHGFSLPASYRAFCERFGAGELGGYMRIASPVGDRCDYELGQFNRDWHGPPEMNLLARYGPPEVIDRLFFFASTIGGEGYAWKLDEVTDATRHEYAVYYKPRYIGLVRVASGFLEFLEKQCLSPMAEPDSNTWTPDPVFLRFEP